MPEEGVADLRRTGWWALACVAVLCVLFWQSLFGGKVLTQADALNLFEPWASAAPAGFQAQNPLLLDQATGFLPWNDFVAEELRRGELPLWCPYNYGGIPLVGTYQSAIYWPLSWVYYLWPSWHAYAWIAVLLLGAAGIFMQLFLRRLGLSPGAAAVGGLGYMLCGFMVAWLNHPHSNVALFLPALLWSIERMAARPTRREAALFGILFGVQLLGGHVQTSVHVALFTGAWALCRTRVSAASRRLGARDLGWLAGCAALGVLLAAPQILPFVEYLRHSQAFVQFARDDLVAGEGVQAASIMLLDPSFYGAPHTHDYRGPLGPNLNYNELIGGYVGRVLLLLAMAQLAWFGWRAPRRGVFLFFAVAVVVAGLVAYQVDPFYSLFRSVPQLSRTKLMRFLLFVAFSLCVLGAMGLEALLRRLPGRRGGLLAAAVFALVALELCAFARGYNPEVDADTLLPRTEVTDFLQADRTPHRVLGVDNSILKPNANTFCRIPMLSGYDSMEDRRFTELVLRMTSTRPEFPFISQIVAFDRIEALPLASLLGVKYLLLRGGLPPPLRKVLDAELEVWENPQAMPKAFLAREVSVIEDPERRLDYLSSASFDPRVAVLDVEGEGLRLLRDDLAGARGSWRARLSGDGAAPPAPPTEARVEVRRYAPREIELRVAAPQRALLVVTDVWDPGWSASVRSAAGDLEVPIERVDHALRGIFVEPGEWTVRLRYDPLSTRIGLWLSLGAALGLVLLGRRRA